MTLRCTYINYTDEALLNIIKNKENRAIAMEKTLESIGGELIGYYGLIGQDYEVVIISEFEKQTDYMALVMSAYLGGAVSEIKTVTCWTGPELVISSKKIPEVSYIVPKS